MKRQGLDCRVGVLVWQKKGIERKHTGKRGMGQRKDKVLVKHTEETQPYRGKEAVRNMVLGTACWERALRVIGCWKMRS